MIVGNKSAGAERRVGVWDRLDVHGSLGVDAGLTANGDVTAKRFCINGTCIDEAKLKHLAAL
jgi:hypothetical protein